ncbi:MAG TPA: hypothetical protein VFW14_09305 [Gaiellales bacterium]|nr:hypothetical protein [Gaiellales bacterium]
MRANADQITRAIADVDGVIDAHPDFSEDLPHVDVRLGQAAARVAAGGRRPG